jgi:hypothetical protein
MHMTSESHALSLTSPDTAICEFASSEITSLTLWFCSMLQYSHTYVEIYGVNSSLLLTQWFMDCHHSTWSLIGTHDMDKEDAICTIFVKFKTNYNYSKYIKKDWKDVQMKCTYFTNISIVVLYPSLDCLLIHEDTKWQCKNLQCVRIRDLLSKFWLWIYCCQLIMQVQDYTALPSKYCPWTTTLFCHCL